MNWHKAASIAEGTRSRIRVRATDASLEIATLSTNQYMLPLPTIAQDEAQTNQVRAADSNCGGEALVANHADREAQGDSDGLRNACSASQQPMPQCVLSEGKDYPLCVLLGHYNSGCSRQASRRVKPRTHFEQREHFAQDESDTYRAYLGTARHRQGPFAASRSQLISASSPETSKASFSSSLQGEFFHSLIEVEALEDFASCPSVKSYETGECEVSFKGKRLSSLTTRPPRATPETKLVIVQEFGGMVALFC